MKAIPDSRLLTCAECVRQGAVLGDIGCDHALLPIFLLEAGKIERAVCADIASGPLRTAEKNLKRHALSDKAVLVKTDGLVGLDGYGITDITVCGMGGELIADILSRAEFIKNPDIRLILQPMTHPERLCSYLCESGFKIDEDRYCRASGKIYRIIVAHFDGKIHNTDFVTLETGVCPLDVEQRILFEEYEEKCLKSHQKSLLGKKGTDLDYSDDEKFICEVLKRKEERK